MSTSLVKQENKEKTPDFAKTEWYEQLLNEIKVNFTRPAPLSINKISKKLTVSQQRVSQVLTHDYTKKMIQQIVDEQGIKDLNKVYNTIRDNVKNPGQARIWMEYFSPVRKKDTAQSGDIIINLGILNQPEKNVEEAEYTEIGEENTE